jgi:hypothetical protein
MTDTMSHPPERTATAAELADEAARIERALTGRQLPRTLAASAPSSAGSTGRSRLRITAT